MRSLILVEEKRLLTLLFFISFYRSGGKHNNRRSSAEKSPYNTNSGCPRAAADGCLSNSVWWPISPWASGRRFNVNKAVTNAAVTVSAREGT